MYVIINVYIYASLQTDNKYTINGTTVITVHSKFKIKQD